MIKRQGFTLIEILIVVAIIAILASVVLIGLGPTQQAGRDSRRLSDLREVQNGLELYFNKCGYYPGAAAPNACTAAYAAANSWDGMTTALTGSAIGTNQIPEDPTSGHTYYYGTNAGGASYIIATTLENGTNSVFNTYTPPSIVGYTIGGSTKSTIPFTACTVAAKTYCITL